MSNASNVSSPRNEAIEVINTVFARVDAVLDVLNDGEKVWLNAIVADVSEQLSLSFDKLYPVVSFYMSRRTDVTVVRGRFGGLFKGSRALKAAKPETEKQAKKREERVLRAEEKAKTVSTKAASLRAQLGARGAQAEAA